MADANAKRRRVLQRVSSIEVDPAPDLDLNRYQTTALGIQEAADLKVWPLDVARSLCTEEDHEIAARLKHRLMCGIQLNTDYSGLDCPREALEMGMCALAHHLQVQPHSKPVWVGRTCDKGQVQTKLQVEHAMKVDDGTRCHFEDILHRLPDHAQAWIAAATPKKADSKEKRLEAFQSISQWVMSNRKLLFDLNAECFCSVHRRPACALHSSCRLKHCRQRCRTEFCPQQEDDGCEVNAVADRLFQIAQSPVHCQPPRPTPRGPPNL